MIDDLSFIAAVSVMAIAAFATRIAGPALMSRLKPTARTDRFLEGLAVSVIAALIASQLVTADIKTYTAVIAAVVVMAAAKSPVWAMLAGMVTAASYPIIAAL